MCDTYAGFLFLLSWEQLNKQKSINAMNMAINRFFSWHSSVFFEYNAKCNFLASEFIALIADKLQLQLKGAEVSNFWIYTVFSELLRSADPCSGQPIFLWIQEYTPALLGACHPIKQEYFYCTFQIHFHWHDWKITLKMI